LRLEKRAGKFLSASRFAMAFEWTPKARQRVGVKMMMSSFRA
jgi:hypothetical protein